MKHDHRSNRYDDDGGSLERLLGRPGLDPETLGEPPLRDGEDPLLTRSRVTLEVDEE